MNKNKCFIIILQYTSEALLKTILLNLVNDNWIANKTITIVKIYTNTFMHGMLRNVY